MMRSLNEVSEVLYGFIQPDSAAARGGKHLSQMRPLLHYLGDPQQTLRVVHVAGTSGKTSTSYFIRGLLEAAGQRTGMMVSPHISSITERWQLAGQPIREAQFIRAMNRFLPLVRASGTKPTYLELLTAFAYWFFAQSELDYAVVETGMGGLYDHTNVVRRADKLCVISDIGLDHTEWLGGTIQEIAAHKAGIIGPGNHAVVQAQDAAVLGVIAATARNQAATLEVVQPQAEPPAALPTFQKRNWVLALAAYQYLAVRDGLPALSPSQFAGVARQQPPGRMEERVVGGKLLILDGAHNPQKIQGLVTALTARGIKQAAVLAGFNGALGGKTKQMLAILQPIVAHLVIPDFVVHPSLKRQPEMAAMLAAYARRNGFASVETAKSPGLALAVLLASREPALVVTGSLYLVGQVRQQLPDRR